MKRLSIPLLLSAVLLSTACERHSASSLPSHGAHSQSEAHPPAHDVGAPKHEVAPKEAPVEGKAPKFFEQQPAK
jgi:hypothetical protein